MGILGKAHALERSLAVEKANMAKLRQAKVYELMMAASESSDDGGEQ